MREKNANKYFKFLLYFLVIVLLNAVAATMFFHWDLTSDGLYSISPVSKDVVSTLSEPLTVHVFFTRNLPAPHNNTERYIQDLLKEYAIYGNRNFNYIFHNLKKNSASGNSLSDDSPEKYGVYPVQLQYIEKDQVKLLKAYMGMAIIHGDLVERIPSITSTDGLEYQITTAIKKMNNKISALLRLPGKIKVKLVLSSSLKQVAPYMNLPGLAEIPRKAESLVKKLNEKTYGKLDFQYMDPTSDKEVKKKLSRYRLLELQWPELTDAFGKKIQAGSGIAGLIIEFEKKFQEFQLINAVNLPLVGTRYSLPGDKEIESFISNGLENLININDSIGYVSDRGTLSLTNPMQAMGQTSPDTISNFNRLVSRNYTLDQVKLQDDTLSGKFKTLIIAGAKEKFSDYELFKLDQFLMEGNHIAVFYDSFREIMPNRNNRFMNQNQGPMYLPLDSGLEKLLNHYGVQVSKSYVMDEKCFRRRVDERFGGGEQSFYFAPVIQPENVNREVDFLHNLNRIVLLKTSPIQINDKVIKQQDIRARVLLKSTDQAWEMKERINLNPYFISKPQDTRKLGQHTLAVMLAGEFTSYFADKTVPEKNAEKKLDSGQTGSKAEKSARKDPRIDMSKIRQSGRVIKKGKPGKIILIGNSEILKNNVIDEAGRSQNAIFIMNLLDHLNSRDNMALMRSKQQTVSLLDETGSGTKSLLKTFNIIGLPLIVIIAGIFIWLRRKARRRRIKTIFSK